MLPHWVVVLIYQVLISRKFVIIMTYKDLLFFHHKTNFTSFFFSFLLLAEMGFHRWLCSIDPKLCSYQPIDRLIDLLCSLYQKHKVHLSQTFLTTVCSLKLAPHIMHGSSWSFVFCILLYITQNTFHVCYYKWCLYVEKKNIL